MQPFVFFQGLGPRDWAALYKQPRFKRAIQWGNKILRKHNVLVEGRPLNLVEACRKGGLVLEEHSQTCWQQVCILLLSKVLWEEWQQEHAHDNPILGGLSFGEWSAAAAAGCVDWETAVLIATMRGVYTSRAGGSSLLVTAPRGTLPVQRLRFRCKRAGVWLASINSSRQGVISGHTPALQELERDLKARYPHLRTTRLALGGPFHTPLMRIPRRQMTRWLKEVEFQAPKFPLVLNANGEITQDAQEIKTMLLRQMSARLNFKKRAEEIPAEAPLYELCLEEKPIVLGLVRQTRETTHRTKAGRTASPSFSA